ncbi:MAG: hypothetical protein Q8K45_18240 [Rubrivivax sp.]|nr:hypothetical protein [Rubrivivax sp.]
MQMTRRTLGLSLLALAAPRAHAVIMQGGGCGGWDWDPSWWPRGSAVEHAAQQVRAGHLWRLDPPMRNATRDQWAAHMAAIFPQLVEQGFARLPVKVLNRRLLQSSDLELGSLAQLYASDLDGLSRIGRALPVAAVRCSDEALARLAGAFGSAAVYEAIALHAPQKLPAFERATGGGIIAPPMNQQSFSPNVDMTLKRIYEGFRLAPTGATSIPASLYQTATYAGRHLALSYAYGYAFGTAVAGLIEWASPTLWHDIGGTINEIVNDLSGLTGVPLGQAQEAISYDFGLLSLHDRLEQTGGDYAAVEAWADYAGYGYSGGGC